MGGLVPGRITAGSGRYARERAPMNPDERPTSLGDRVRRALRVRGESLPATEVDDVGGAAGGIADPLVRQDPELGTAEDVREVVVELLSGRRDSDPTAARLAEGRLLESQLRRLGTRSVTLCRAPALGAGRCRPWHEPVHPAGLRTA